MLLPPLISRSTPRSTVLSPSPTPRRGADTTPGRSSSTARGGGGHRALGGDLRFFGFCRRVSPRSRPARLASLAAVTRVHHLTRRAQRFVDLAVGWIWCPATSTPRSSAIPRTTSPGGTCRCGAFRGTAAATLSNWNAAGLLPLQWLIARPATSTQQTRGPRSTCLWTSQQPDPARLLAQYANDMERHRYADHAATPNGLDATPNGVAIDDRMRHLYREAILAAEHDETTPRPGRTVMPDSFLEWLGRPAESTGPRRPRLVSCRSRCGPTHPTCVEVS